MSGSIRELVGQVARFGISGGLNTLVYIGCGKGLLAMGLGHAVTGALALLMASATGYVLHRIFSFRSRNAGGGEAARFAVLVGFNTIISSFTLPLLAKTAGLPDTAALMSISLILPFSNFIAMRLWIFRPRGSSVTA